MGEISQSIRVNSVRVNALIDTGATMNYMSKSLATRLKIPLYEKYKFSGIGHKIFNAHIAYVTTQVFNRTGSTCVAVTDMLPMDGYDIILGQQFLQDNEVILDFKKDKFRFSEHQPKIRRIGRL